jgi:hypothetical protein
MNFMYDLYRNMISQKLILVYHGDITQETTKSILTMAESSLDSSENDPVIRRKVFNVMVESLQNIVKHGKEDTPQGHRGQQAIFLFGREATGYSVMSGNPINKQSVSALKATLDRINNLDKNGLKDLYRDIIQGTSISDKGGAGLGFVDMARKSGEKLSFDFPEMSSTSCLFCLKVNISLES